MAARASEPIKAEGERVPEFLHTASSVTRFPQEFPMPPSACRLFELCDRRDQMILAMATDAARAKAKFREARHKKARQMGYRRVRYQRFQGRRSDVTEEEIREAVRVRRAKSIRAMASWLEAQAQAIAEEGTPREEQPGLEAPVPSGGDAEPVDAVPKSAAPEVARQRLITLFFRSAVVR